MTLYEPLIEMIKSRDGESARNIARKALEALDAGWSRRHPPPAAGRHRAGARRADQEGEGSR